MDGWWNDTYRGQTKYLEKTCTTDSLSTVNPTRTGLGSNPCLPGERPLTRVLSNGTTGLPSLAIYIIASGNHAVFIHLFAPLAPLKYMFINC
jgi:hypothetical protein